MDLVDRWPLFGLRLRTPRLELRVPSDAEAARLMDVVDRAGVHDAGVRPFAVPWTEVEPIERGRRGLQFYWRTRADWSVDDWHLALVSFVDDEPIGSVSLMGTDFLVTRAVSTGSWIRLDRHGEGLGTEQRAAVLHLAFTELAALEALSAAWEDNPSSQRVSEKLGYEPNGARFRSDEGTRRSMVDLRLTRDRWEASPADAVPVAVEGFEACRETFGLEPDEPSGP